MLKDVEWATNRVCSKLLITISQSSLLESEFQGRAIITSTVVDSLWTVMTENIGVFGGVRAIISSVVFLSMTRTTELCSKFEARVLKGHKMSMYYRRASYQYDIMAWNIPSTRHLNLANPVIMSTSCQLKGKSCLGLLKLCQKQNKTPLPHVQQKLCKLLRRTPPD